MPPALLDPGTPNLALSMPHHQSCDMKSAHPAKILQKFYARTLIALTIVKSRTSKAHIHSPCEGPISALFVSHQKLQHQKAHILHNSCKRLWRKLGIASSRVHKTSAPAPASSRAHTLHCNSLQVWISLRHRGLGHQQCTSCVTPGNLFRRYSPVRD
jgi:hypothetical protein